VPTTTVHRFRKSLAWSNSPKVRNFWRAAYAMKWPTVEWIEYVTDLHLQRHGVDVRLHLANGEVVCVDEKSRDYTVDARFTADIAIEYAHEYHDGSTQPGWIEKDDMYTNWLAYGWVPSGRACFIDWLALRELWRKSGKTWRMLCPEDKLIKAPNADYRTLSVPVWLPELEQRLPKAAFFPVGI